MNSSAPAQPHVVAMLPGPSRATEWDRTGNGHLRAIADELPKNGWEILPISADDFLFARSFLENCALAHVHWTESLALAAQPPRWLKAIAALQTAAGRKQPHPLIERFAMNAVRAVAKRRPLVYQAHDLESNWLEPARTALFDRAFKRAFLRSSDAWVVHESACLPLLERHAARPRSIAVCPLGDYACFHGSPIDRAEARRRLSWSRDEKIFLYAGHSAARRNPGPTAAAFARLAPGQARLVIASRQARRYVSARAGLEIFDEFLDNETIRDLYCAADWVVMPGRVYLNSAVVRTALSYARPVICIDFGSQSDMARDAALWLEDDSAEAIHQQLCRACAMAMEEYATFSAAAALRSAERRWDASLATYAALLTQLANSAAARPDIPSPRG